MRIALALGLCLVAVAAVAAPRGKGGAKPEVQAPAQTDTQRENYRVRMNENVVTIMAGSPNGTDLGIAYDIAQVVDEETICESSPSLAKGPRRASRT